MPKIFKLNNGLSVIVKPVDGTRAVTFFAMVPVGSRYEEDKLSGVSHFVEHLMFKGTKKRPTTLHISRELDAAGAEFNAFTSKDHTAYFIKIDSSKTDLALDILSDMIFNSKFDAEEVERERGVILEEIKMYLDNPAAAVSMNFERLLFGTHPLGREIIGTKKIIGAITRRDLYDYYKSAYRPENIVLVVAGGVKNNINPKIRKYFDVKLAESTGKKITKNNFEKFLGKQIPSGRINAEKRKLDQANVVLGFPGIRYNDPRRYAFAVLQTIVGRGMSSRLYLEVREKRGLAYRIAMGGDAFRDCGTVVIETGLDVRRLGEAVRVIKDELKKICRQQVSPKELADAKSNIAGRITLSMENSSDQALWYAIKYWFQNQLIGYDKEIRRVKKVTAKQVMDLARDIFRFNKMKIAIVSPLNKKSVIKTLK